MEKLQHVQNAAARLITGTGKYERGSVQSLQKIAGENAKFAQNLREIALKMR